MLFVLNSEEKRAEDNDPNYIGRELLGAEDIKLVTGESEQLVLRSIYRAIYLVSKSVLEHLHCFGVFEYSSEDEISSLFSSSSFSFSFSFAYFG